ncbi:MAG: diheme cytochrome c-553 [Chitinophagaceae bacterium]
MKKYIIVAVASVAIALAIFSYTGPLFVSKPVVTKDSLIKKGSYLVTIMGCNDCHTPFKMGPNGPEKDMDRLLSGHPEYIPVLPFDTATTKNWALFGLSGTSMIGPWGSSFAGNLTSDATGIGNWTYEQFKNVFTKGKFKGLDANRPILPPMPWENYVNMNDEDMQAIFAYLKSTKPVKNVVPQHVSPDKLSSYLDQKPVEKKL